MKRFLILALVLGLASSAYAVDSNWTGAVDSEWSTAGNWDLGVPDGTALIHEHDGTVTQPIIDSDIGTLGRINIGASSGANAATLAINAGADIELTDRFSIGDGESSVGILNMSGGYMFLHTSAASQIGNYGVGIMTMTGGLIEGGANDTTGWGAVLEIGKKGTSDGTFNFLGGVIDVPYFKMSRQGGDAAMVIENDAVLYVRTTDWDLPIDNLNDYIALGWITSSETITVEDIGGGAAKMYVPEPMTIALLGLGGLFLRRRK